MSNQRRAEMPQKQVTDPDPEGAVALLARLPGSATRSSARTTVDKLRVRMDDSVRHFRGGPTGDVLQVQTVCCRGSVPDEWLRRQSARA
jgi:hypothetical protein